MTSLPMFAMRGLRLGWPATSFVESAFVERKTTIGDSRLYKQ